MSARRRAVSALIVLALGGGLAVAVAPPASAATDTTIFEMTGDPSDYITQGATRSFAPPATPISVGGTSALVQASVGGAQSWDIWFQAPDGQQLTAGTTYDTVRVGSASGATAGFELFGDGRACNTLSGTFTVLEIQTDAGTGDVTRFAGSFVSHCEGVAAAARGVVYYHSTLAYAAASTLTLTGPASVAPGASVGLSGSLTNGAGPIPGATVTLSRTDASGITALPDVVTGNDGTYSTTATLGLSDATFTASYAGDADHAPTQATWQVAALRPASSLTVVAPTAVRRGVAYTLSGILSNGARLANKLITVRRTDLAGTKTFSLRTNASGVYAYRDLPAVGGLVTWTVSWAGDAYRAPVTASRRVTVTRLATAVTLKASAASYAYGGKAVVTIHLGTTYNRRDVYLYARPLAPGGPAVPGTLVAHVKVNSLGNAVVSYLVRSRTTFTVKFAGDYRYNPAARAITVNSTTRVALQIGGTGYKVGSTYVVTGDAAYFRATTAPLRTSGCVTFQLQQYYAGRWVTADTVPCAAIQGDYYAYAVANRQLIGVTFRVRAYVGANSYSLGGSSAWITFRFG